MASRPAVRSTARFTTLLATDTLSTTTFNSSAVSSEPSHSSAASHESTTLARLGTMPAATTVRTSWCVSGRL